MIYFVIIPVIILILVIFYRCLSSNDVAEYKPMKPAQVNGKTDEKLESDLNEHKRGSERKYKTINFAVKGIVYRSSLEIQIAKNVKHDDREYYDTLRLLQGEYSGKYHVFERYVRERGSN